MKIGSVKEVKGFETRVGLTPRAVASYIENGHVVYIEKNAGLLSGFLDADYIAVGAKIVDNPKDVWNRSDMIIKINKPLESEYKFFRKGLILLAYLNLETDKLLTTKLIEKEVIAIALEQIKDESGYPCMRPNSEVSGTVLYDEVKQFLDLKTDLETPHIVLIGAGIVAMSFLEASKQSNYQITLLDINETRLKVLKNKFGKIEVLKSNEENIESLLPNADVIILAAAIKGKLAPKLIKLSDYQILKKGALLVDVSIDQGGSIENIHVSKEEELVFEENGIMHYAVDHMASFKPIMASNKLSKETLKFGLKIANLGILGALNDIDALLYGLTTFLGYVTNKDLAEVHGLTYQIYDLI